MLRVCRIVHPPPHPSRVGGWMGGWLVPAPRTDQYLKHREVSSRYFRCPSATGNEGVKNILQIAGAGIIPFTVQVPPIATRGPICGTRDVSHDGANRNQDDSSTRDPDEGGGELKRVNR